MSEFARNEAATDSSDQQNDVKDLAQFAESIHNGPMKPDTVTASDIADWVYCPESLRLRSLGHESANRAVQEAGTVHHTAKATAERVAGGSIALGRILIVVSLLIAIWVLTR